MKKLEFNTETSIHLRLGIGNDQISRGYFRKIFGQGGGIPKIPPTPIPVACYLGLT